jgi:hypothetical protein
LTTAKSPICDPSPISAEGDRARSDQGGGFVGAESFRERSAGGGAAQREDQTVGRLDLGRVDHLHVLDPRTVPIGRVDREDDVEPFAKRDVGKLPAHAAGTENHQTHG